MQVASQSSAALMTGAHTSQPTLSQTLFRRRATSLVARPGRPEVATRVCRDSSDETTPKGPKPLRMPTSKTIQA